mgnify:CR=1 FL=1
MIKVFNSAYGRNSDSRDIPLDEVNVVTMKLDFNGAPYMLFEHSDYPGGALRAQFRNDVWECDLD